MDSESIQDQRNEQLPIDPEQGNDDLEKVKPEGKSWKGCLITIGLLILIIGGLGYYAWTTFRPSTKRLTIPNSYNPDLAPAGTFGMDARIPKGLTPTPTFTQSLTPTITPTPTSTPSPTLTPSPTPIPEITWQYQLLQPVLAVGAFSTLAIDSQGYQHVLYFQDNNDLIWYAHNDSGEWEFEFIQGGVGHGFHLSLVLDEQDRPHFVYNNVGPKNNRPYIWYRWLSDQGWSGPYREGNHSVANTDVSMTLGVDGRAYFSFQAEADYSMMIADFSQTSGFNSQKIGEASKNCRSLPIQTDPSGGLHTAFCSYQGLVYATKTNEDWQLEIVDPSEEAGIFVDLALDKQGVPHLAYFDFNTATLRYANRENGQWKIQVVDAEGDVGRHTSLALDPDGSPHISYYDRTNRNLKYAFWQDSVWSIQTIDKKGDVGTYNSIALDPISGNPWISYFDATNEDLKIAWGSRR